MCSNKQLNTEFLLQTQPSTHSISSSTPLAPLYQPNTSPTILQQVISASSAAMITSLVVTPLDVIKTRLQTQTNPSLFKTVHSTFMENGFRSFWKGLSPSLLMQLPSSGIYYTVFDNTKTYMTKQYPNSASWMIALSAGFVSRIITTMITTPFEYVRTATQASTEPLSLKQLIVNNQNQVSIRKLWQGTTITLMRDVPFSALYWSLFDIFSTKQNSSHRSAWTQNFISGFCAGSVAAAITTPMDVIKSNIQQINGGDRIGLVTKQIYQQEGFTGFFKGIVPRVARAAPSCAIMISTYELLKKV